jgi:hypothetical protein
MHSKVVTPDSSRILFAKLACAVERINDPNAFGDQPARIICRLF